MSAAGIIRTAHPAMIPDAKAAHMVADLENQGRLKWKVTSALGGPVMFESLGFAETMRAHSR